MTTTYHFLMMALVALSCLECVNAQGNTTTPCYNDIPGDFSCSASPECQNSPCMTSDHSAGHCKGMNNYCYKNTNKSCQECASQYSTNGGCPNFYANMSNYTMQNSYLGDCENRMSECFQELQFDCVRNGYYPPPESPPMNCWNGTPSDHSCSTHDARCRGQPCRRDGDLPGECGDNGQCVAPLVCQTAIGNNTCYPHWQCGGRSCDITATQSGVCYQYETKCGVPIDCQTCAERFFDNGGCPNLMGDPNLFNYLTHLAAQHDGCSGRENECGMYTSLKCLAEGYSAYTGSHNGTNTDSNNSTSPATCTPPQGLSDLVMQSDIHCQTDSDCRPLKEVVTSSSGFWCWKDHNNVGKCGPEGEYPSCIGGCMDACNLYGDIENFSSTQCECFAKCDAHSACNSEEKRSISHILKTCHFPDPFAPPPKLKCGGGQFVQNKNVKDMEHCMECPPGRFSKPTTYRNKKCKKCPRGSVAPLNGATHCTKCPEGMKHNNARTECIDIAAKWESPHGAV